MQLDGYELLELTFEGGIQISKLRHQESGRNFLVHAFHGPMLAEFDRICLQLAAIPREMSLVVETQRDLTSGLIRTELLPAGIGIAQWAGQWSAGSGDTEAERIYRLALQLKSQRIDPSARFPG